MKYREMFRGTLDSAKVHPRELVHKSIEHNGAAIIFASNQPSGDCGVERGESAADFAVEGDDDHY